MEQTKLVVIQSFGSREEAELAKGLLESAGISAMTRGDTAGGMRDHLAWSGAGFQVLVREEDARAALDALAPTAGGDVDDEDPAFRTPWRRFT